MSIFTPKTQVNVDYLATSQSMSCSCIVVCLQHCPMIMDSFARCPETTMLHAQVMSQEKPSSDERFKPSMTRSRRKRISFQENRNCTTILSESYDTDKKMWYTKDEVNDMKEVVGVSKLAINDICGDIDDIDHVAICRRAVMAAQVLNIDLARISEAYSESSIKLARLHALLLEKDILAAGRGRTTTQNDLSKIVSHVMLQGEDVENEKSKLDQEDRYSHQDFINHDDESIGTIDDMPTESWQYNSISDEDTLELFAEMGDGSSQVPSLINMAGEIFPKDSIRGIPRIESIEDDNMIHPNSVGKPPALVTLGTLALSQSKPIGEDTENFSKEVVPPEWGILKPEHLPSSSKVAIVKKSSTSYGFTNTRTDESFMHDKRAFDAEQEDLPCSFPPSKRQCGISTNDQIENGPQVAHALISLARWEFRSYHLPFQH